MSDNERLTITAIKQPHESESEQSDEWNDALSDIYSPAHSSSFSYDEKNKLEISCSDNGKSNESEATLNETDSQKEHANGIPIKTSSSASPWTSEGLLKSPIKTSFSRIPVESFQLARVNLKPVGSTYMQSSQSTPNITKYASHDDNDDDVVKECDVELNSSCKPEQALKKVTFSIPKAKPLPKISEDGQPEWVRIAKERSTKEINWNNLDVQHRCSNLPKMKYASLPLNINNLEAVDDKAHIIEKPIVTPIKESPPAISKVEKSPITYIKLRQAGITKDENKTTPKTKPAWMDELMMKTAAFNCRRALVEAELKNLSSEMPQRKKGSKVAKQSPVVEQLNTQANSSSSFESVLEQIKSFGKDGGGFKLRKTSMKINEVTTKKHSEQVDDISLHNDSAKGFPISDVKETISHTQFIISTDPIVSEETSSMTFSSNSSHNSESASTTYASKITAHSVNDIQADPFNVCSERCSDTAIDRDQHSKVQVEKNNDTVNKFEQNNDIDNKESHLNSVVKENPVDLQSPALVMKLLPAIKKFSSDSNLTQVGNPAVCKRRFSPAFYQMTSSCTDLLSQVCLKKPNTFTFEKYKISDCPEKTDAANLLIFDKDERPNKKGGDEICKSEMCCYLSDNYKVKKDIENSRSTFSSETNSKEYTESAKAYKNNGEYIWTIGGLGSGDVHEKCSQNADLEQLSTKVTTEEQYEYTSEEETTTVVHEIYCTDEYNTNDVD